MQAYPKSETGNDDRSVWFVMTSPFPKSVEESLLEENVRRKACGEQPFQYFVPYRFLKRRVAEAFQEEQDEHTCFNPKSRDEVASHNELCSALKRYIFIKAPVRDLERLLCSSNQKEQCRTLWYYRDASGNKVTVRSAVMEQFINACCDERLRFEVWPALETIELYDEVVLNATPFKGYKARVLAIGKDRNGFSLTVGFHLFQGAMLLKLPGLRPQDVLYEPKEATGIVRETNRYKIVEDIQRKLFLIMNRRLGGNSSEKVRRKDEVVLETLYTYRYRLFESDAMRRKFSALMLLCAVLRGDVPGKLELAARVRSDLKAISLQPEGKVAMDLRAYLQSVLYMATRDQACFDEAMAYYRSHSRPSETHKQWMKFLNTAF